MKISILAFLLSTLMLPPLALAAAPSPARTDNQIEESIKSSFTFRKVLDNDVKVNVSNGVATLSGKVRDDEQSRIAEGTAAEFPGVTRVVNNLSIEGTGKSGSDEWIALKIRGRLLVKSNVSLANTDVEVKNGIVTLTGTVDNAAQKELTESYAKDVEGVRSVTNNLKVGEMGLKSDFNTPAGDRIDDASITARIKYELFSHRSTSALKTKVNTNAGHVVISGDAASDAEKDLVSTLAKSVRGVDSVDNNMTVRK